MAHNQKLNVQAKGCDDTSYYQYRFKIAKSFAYYAFMNMAQGRTGDYRDFVAAFESVKNTGNFKIANLKKYASDNAAFHGGMTSENLALLNGFSVSPEFCDYK